MIRLTNLKRYLGIWVIVLMVLAMEPGFQKSKPPLSPQAVAFTKDVQAIIDRIAPPLKAPVVRRDKEAVKKALVKAFSVCAEACEDMFHNVFILDLEGILTAAYPPADVKALQFSNYKAVKKAFVEKKPNQSILYQPDGTPTYIIYVPLIENNEVAGILALGFKGNQVRDRRGLVTQEFLSLEFRSP
jgi:hypothetical protein